MGRSFTPSFKGSPSLFCYGWIISRCLLILCLSSCGRSFFHVVGWLMYCCLAVLGLGSRVLVPSNISAALSSECACPSVCFILPSLSLADGLNLGPWPIGCLALYLLWTAFCSVLYTLPLFIGLPAWCLPSFHIHFKSSSDSTFSCAKVVQKTCGPRILVEKLKITVPSLLITFFCCFHCYLF